MVGLILQLAGLALAVAWASYVWGIAGGLAAGALVLVLLGVAYSGSPADAPAEPEEETTWTS